MPGDETTIARTRFRAVLLADVFGRVRHNVSVLIPTRNLPEHRRLLCFDPVQEKQDGHEKVVTSLQQQQQWFAMPALHSKRDTSQAQVHIAARERSMSQQTLVEVRIKFFNRYFTLALREPRFSVYLSPNKARCSSCVSVIHVHAFVL